MNEKFYFICSVSLEHRWKLMFKLIAIFPAILDPNYHLSTKNQNNFCITEDLSEDDYVSQISYESC